MRIAVGLATALTLVSPAALATTVAEPAPEGRPVARPGHYDRNGKPTAPAPSDKPKPAPAPPKPADPDPATPAPRRPPTPRRTVNLPVDRITATGETVPVPGPGDAADDSAVWVHPTDPSLSLIVAADKSADVVDVYDLSGQRLQQLADPKGSVNNIDVRHDVLLGGQRHDLVVTGGVHFTVYRVDAATRRLVNVTAGAVTRAVHGGHGMCLYHDRVAERLYVFGAAGNGMVEQLELVDGGAGAVAMRSVRGPWDVHPAPIMVEDGEIEACVADDMSGHLYIAEQDVGIWRYGARPDEPVTEETRTVIGGTLIFNQGAAMADIEGLAIVYSPGGTAYMLASSQGDDSFVVYRHDPEGWALYRKFAVVDGPDTDGCSFTDGIDATPVALGSAFPHGLFMCQDHVNSAPGPGEQNFKLVPLERILPVQ